MNLQNYKVEAMDKEQNHIDTQPEVQTAVPWKQRRWLRELTSRSTLTFTFACALCLLAQLSLSVIIVTQITSLEREFGFTSRQSGSIMSANEIGFLCVAIPASYLATRVHVPRGFSLACFLVGVTGIMCGLPHFIFGTAEPHSNHSQSAVSIPLAFCTSNDQKDSADDQRCQSISRRLGNLSTDTSFSEELVYNANAYRVFVYLMVFQVLRGITGSPRFPMFAVYIEENTVKTESGFYMGILAAITMLGPAIAFLVGGALSKVHVSLKPTDLTPNHPDWVGAWWLGFLVFGALAAVTPLAIFSFPRRLPNAPRRQASLYGRRPKGKGIVEDAVNELKLFLGSLVELFTNPILLLLVVSSCCQAFAMNGTYRYLPKYMQEQFHIPAYKANFLMGGGELLMGTTGFFLGGWLTRRLKLNLRGLLKLAILLTGLGVVLIVVQMLIGCPQPTLIGAPGSDLSSDKELGHCVHNCSCPEEVHPVCSGGLNYFSPCHAGCLGQKDGVYTNCSCTVSGRASPGLCDSGCVSIYPFTVAAYVYLFVASVAGAPGYLLLVRSVADHQAGLAIGLNGFSTSLVGFLIGPMVYGGLIDTFCDHWKSPCGAKGACSVYNLERFRVNMHLYTIVAMSIALLCEITAFLLLRFFKNLRQNRTEETVEKKNEEDCKGSEPMLQNSLEENQANDQELTLSHNNDEANMETRHMLPRNEIEDQMETEETVLNSKTTHKKETRQTVSNNEIEDNMETKQVYPSEEDDGKIGTTHLLLNNDSHRNKEGGEKKEKEVGDQMLLTAESRMCKTFT